jgi:hypothetical protein
MNDYVITAFSNNVIQKIAVEIWNSATLSNYELKFYPDLCSAKISNVSPQQYILLIELINRYPNTDIFENVINKVTCDS